MDDSDLKVAARAAAKACHGEVQALALHAYGHHGAAAYLGLRVRDARRAREVLAKLATRLTLVGNRDRKSDYVNLAFTHEGLQILGVPGDALAGFPVEMREGMAVRGRRLGDVGPSGPAAWRWGGPNNRRIHVLVVLYAWNGDVDSTEAHRKGAPDGLRLWNLVLATARALRTAEDGGRALEVAFVETTQLLPGGVEHFGFRDGLVQPTVVLDPKTAAASPSAIPLGEVILGRKNAYDEVPASPSFREQLPDGTAREIDLGRDGTYLVVRRLEQDVAGFWGAMRERAVARLAARGESPSSAVVDDEATLLASKIVGRWPNGRGLRPGEVLRGSAAWSSPPASADLTFVGDERGLGCPLGAHVRRVNPREVLGDDGAETSQKVVSRHRLVRRGRPFGTLLPRDAADDGRARGLLFVTVGASIRRQFEFLQQQWVESSTFQGLLGEDDPLVGQRQTSTGAFSMPAEPYRERAHALPRFVTTRGGGYFFMPGRAALGWILTRAWPAADAEASPG